MPGNGSLNLDAERSGEDFSEVGVPTAGALVGAPNGRETWCSGDAGRLLPTLGRPFGVLYRLARGEDWNWGGSGTPPTGLGVNSSSASSEMSHTLGAPEWMYESSGGRYGLRVRLGERRGEEGRARGMGEGESDRELMGFMTAGRE